MLYNVQEKKIIEIENETSYGVFKPFSISVATL